MTLHVDILRHGEVAGGACFRGVQDDPLTPAGLAQMRARLESAATGWDMVVTSPLQRCAAFATEFARPRAMPLAVEPGFAELDFGQWEGRTARDIMDDTPDLLTRFWENPMATTPPDGEPLADFAQRVLRAWLVLVAAYRGRRLLVITHGGVMKVLICYILGEPLERVLHREVPLASLLTLRGENLQLNGAPL